MDFNEKALNIYNAIIEILTIFAESEIGGEYEFDNEVIANYLNTKAFVDYFDCKTKEEIYEYFTNDILNGAPVFRMLKIPEWTRTMLEKSFEQTVSEERAKAEKTYRCLTCKYYKETHTSYGVALECKRPEKNPRFHSLTRREEFRLKKSCKDYVKKSS